MRLFRLERVAIAAAIAACSTKAEPPGGTVQASVAPIAAAAPVTASTTAAAEAEVQNLRELVRLHHEEVEALKKAKADLEAQLAKVGAENEQLRRTPQVALAEASAKLGSGTDNGDRDAIAAYQAVALAYPTDPAAAAAHAKIDELNKGIAARAKALAAAQAEVRKLIKTCRSNALQANRPNSIHFNEFNQVDMNQLMAVNERTERLSKVATKAKEKAAELVKTVPDPDGKLAAEIEKCDEVQN